MKLISEKNPIEVFTNASQILYDAVAHTLGPAGANTAVVYGKDVQANPKFQIINDGKSIIDNLTSTDAETACALQTIRESVLSTNNIAGDGTTSTIILINALLKNLSKVDLSSFEICRQLSNIRKIVTPQLKNYATHPINDTITIEQIAETSLGSKEYVNLFKQAFDFVGTNGKVLLEQSNLNLPCVEEIDGLSFNQVGFIPELVVDETGNIKKQLEDCQTIIIKGDINNFNIISNLLLKSKTSENSIILFYDRMTTDVLRLVLHNLIKNEYNLYPISLEGYGDEILKYTQLISTITGSKVIEASSNIDYNDSGSYGKIDGIIFNKDAIIIKPINDLLSKTTKYIEDNKFNISTKTAIIKAGANNSIALEEQYRRFEDAIHSCAGALKDGVCLGGGLTYIWFAQQLIDGDYITPILGRPVVDAFSSVYYTLLENCGINDISNLDECKLPKLNEETGEYILSDNCVYDSYKVTEQVLLNTIDMVHSIFSTKVLICDPQR